MPPRRAGHEKVDIDFTLRRVFNKKSFRPLQREVITATIEGHDVFLQAATSFGKSLCFQLPAAVSSGITVVISPLLALMTNQINATRALGIPTESISGSTTKTERRRIENDLKCGHPYTRLLYITPELLAMQAFRKVLTTIHQQGQLIRVAIDEAHCISEWGHDFRPAYKELKWLKETLILPSVPITALTATATARVRVDIVKCLKLAPLASPSQGTAPVPTPSSPAQTLFFSTSSARPNIHYEVRYFSEASPQHASGDDLFANLIDWLRDIGHRRIQHLRHLTDTEPASVTASTRSPITGIIYVPLRVTADTLATRLTTSGIPCQSYHAGLELPTRTAIQSTFTSPPIPTPEQALTLGGSFNLIAATTAFGMGIDAPHVRFVAHYGLPRALEQFVQESGRAGRDGKAAASVLFYTREERDRVADRVRADAAKNGPGCGSGGSSSSAAAAKGDSLRAVIGYCEDTRTCRHEIIAAYFGEEEEVGAERCDFACDYCKEGQVALRRRKEKGLASEAVVFEFSQREARRGEASQVEEGDPYDYWSQR